jgi:hypothetical protein
MTADDPTGTRAEGVVANGYSNIWNHHKLLPVVGA